MFISISLYFALLCHFNKSIQMTDTWWTFFFHSLTEWNAERPKCGCHKDVNDFSIWNVMPTMIIIIAVSFRTKNQQTNRRHRIDVKMDRLYQRWQFLFVILTFDFFLFFLEFVPLFNYGTTNLWQIPWKVQFFYHSLPQTIWIFEKRFAAYSTRNLELNFSYFRENYRHQSNK